MTTATEFIRDAWKGETLEALKEFIRIPSKSQSFDSNWEANGYLRAALEQAAAWGAKRFPAGTFDIISKPGIAPALFIDLPATGGHDGRPFFLYGHLDKQPETEGWREGFGPWTPVVEGDRLYGRGAADDGYSFYAGLTAVQALEAEGTPHPRIVGLFETAEESGSVGLVEYLEDITARAGNPCVLAILDLGLCDYDRLWLTRSLRGVGGFKLKVEVLEQPVHSGTASGKVPSSFAVMRQLLDRLEDPATGRVKIPEFHVEIPEGILEEIRSCAKILGEKVLDFPWAGSTEPRSSDPATAIRMNTWEPTLSILGADGLPPTSSASGLIRASTTLALSFRIPAGADPKAALAAAERAVTENVPSKARVTVFDSFAEPGFVAPDLAPWLLKAADEASREFWGNGLEFCFEGATIGTMKNFAACFPEASFFNAGLLGAKESAHAPNESLLLPYVERLTATLARVIAAVPHAGK
ncbi:M20/M25/M40 family metallo-hydrolase [Sutterella sp.]|uniref:M20/M25/M40 family metallo-hydrolase n=1 Tax=Sutterella sp. TaxID=1981025 RepID=UPI0026DF3801|nr:M20/M25/M40 family metallo-hydrolase [Sutterella sp.]MDO5530417.1 M20/M25/M40 family metallo-hydrolase [Sutterella sp.]